MYTRAFKSTACEDALIIVCLDLKNNMYLHQEIEGDYVLARMCVCPYIRMRQKLMNYNYEICCE